jgi:signal transduction histidine kinase
VDNVATVPRDNAFAAMSDVVLAIAGELRLDAVLDRLVHAARELVDARYAALGIPDEDGTEFDQFLHAGMSDDLVAQLGPLPRTHGMLGAMLSDPRPFRTDDITTDPRFRGWWPDAHPRMRSFLGVPIVAKGDIIGAFYLTEKEGAASGGSGSSADRSRRSSSLRERPAAFDEADEKVITVLAAHAAIAIENARLFEASRELSVIEERNRLARELHDAMTQNLFSLSLTAEAAAGLVRTDPGRAEAEIDRVRQLARETQAELRSLVFELRPPRLEADGLVATVGKDLDVLGRAHGLKVDLQVHGTLEVASTVEMELYRIVQEALNNAVRHARAESITVGVDAADGVVTITVRDDGVGFDPAARAIRERRLGLTSMRERAESLGGKFTVETAPRAGTTVRVEVPSG